MTGQPSPRSRWPRSVLFALLLLPLLLLLLLFSGVWWVLESETGTRWLWERAAAMVPGELEAGSVDGALADGFAVSDLRYASETVEVSVTAARLTVTPTVFPPALELAGVSAGEVTIRLQPSSPVPESDAVSIADILSMLELPLPVRVDGLSLDALRVLAADDREIFAMRGVRLAGRMHETMELRHARLAIGDFAIEGSGTVALSAPHPIEADVRLEIDSGAAAFLNDMPVRFAATLQGRLDDLEVDVEGESPPFRLEGSVRQVTTRPQWDVELRADALQWPLAVEDPAVRASDVRLASAGNLQGYSLEGTASVEVRDSGEMQAALLRATGDTTGIDVADLEVSGPLAAGSVRGRVGWSPALAIEADAQVARFDLHRFVPRWPEDRAVSGHVDAIWQSGSIELADLEVAVENSSMTLQSSGTIDPAGGIVDLSIDWQEVEWPVGAEAPQIRSDTGAIRLAGSPDDWRLDGQATLAVAEYPEGTFVLRGEGDRGQAAVTLAESRVLGGTAAGSLQYNWRDGGRWSASLAVNGIHTEPVLAAWPGVLDARFDAAGQVSPFHIDIELDSFDGTMRGLPVAGSGGFTFGPDELRFRQLEIDSGDSSLAVNGMLRSAEGIDFDVEVDALGTFLRAASGSLEASGNVAMPDGFPRLDLALDGRDLGWRQYRAGSLSIESVQSPDRPLALRLTAAELELGGRALDTVTARVAAGRDTQRFEAELARADRTLHFVLDGAFGDWRQPLASGWSGSLETLELAAGPEFALVLEAPAGVELSPDSFALEEACLAGRRAANAPETFGESVPEVCGSGHWAGAGDFHAAATLDAFPVDALGLVLDTGLDFTQTLDGSMTFSRTSARALSGEMQLDISAGRISNRIDERLATTTRPGVLQLQLENGQLLSGQLRLPFSEASKIDAQFDVLDVGRGETSPIEGRLQLEVNDIGVAASVAPMIDAASGRLAADVRMSGTVREPQFMGEGSLDDGSLTYEPLGLRLEDMVLSGAIRERNRLELEGTFRAGEGSGRIYTSADYLDGAETGLRVSLSGRQLTVVDVPDLRVIADPELDFGLDDGTITINGSIVVPQARLSPASLTANPVRESGDVVVVAGQEAEAEEAPPPEDGIDIQGEVELTLGDDIVVDLDVADARVTGETTFRWSGPPMPVASGQYRVSGNFQAYGQLLQITEGIVNFPNVPANNPVLRIRAEREIFGNSQIRSAGVAITGTAKDPEVEVYTTPRTNESRALTLLVTGSDFNFEQGVGAVDVGTYIAPKLYLSYGIGLFERENVISLRYDIARGFGIKASSSSRTDGVDLSYTLER